MKVQRINWRSFSRWVFVENAGALAVRYFPTEDWGDVYGGLQTLAELARRQEIVEAMEDEPCLTDVEFQRLMYLKGKWMEWAMIWCAITEP